MQYWSIKEIADILEVSYQAIYKNYDKLKKLGYIETIERKK